MHRLALRAMAEEKLRDAQLLLQHGRHANSYYLAGYAVEIGLKACIAKRFEAEVIPDLKLVRSIYDHNLANLTKVAGLDADLSTRKDASIEFATNWTIVLGWTPERRYATMDEESAGELVAAVAGEPNGVLRWIRENW